MKKITLNRLALAAASVGTLTLYGCGGGGGDGTSSTPTPSSSAVLNDAPVKGVCYSALPSGLFGATSATGTYQYQSGDNVSFWINVNGAACGSTPADSLSTTAISLGSMIPGTATGGTSVQTFILAMDTGPQAAQVLQALNHGTTNSMDVSGITLPAAQVTNLNTYLAAGGDTSQVSGTPSVQALFSATQTAATVVGGAPLVLPVTSTFEATVSTNLATTVATGLGTPPSTFTIPANRLNFGSSSGTQTTSGVTTPFNGASITWFDGNGVGKRFVSPGGGLSTITTANLASNIGRFTQPFTYTISGNVVSKTIKIRNSGDTADAGSISDANTIAYTDDHGSFFSGTSTKTITSPASTTTNVYSGASIRLTPLTTSMFAGKTLTLAAARCPNGISTNIFSSDGSTVQNTNCGPNGGTGEIRTHANSSIPGIVMSSSTAGVQPDGSIILIGLDGPSVAVGSTLVVLTLNSGGGDFPATGRMKILAVK